MNSRISSDLFPTNNANGFSQHTMVSRGVRYILFAAGMGLLAIILWRIRDIVLVCFGGLIGAITLRDLAAFFTRRFGLTEKWALALTLTLLLTGFSGLAWFFGNQTANEFGELQNLIPKALDQLKTTLQRSSAGRSFIEIFNHAIGDSKMLANMGTLAGGFLEGFTDLFLIIFISVYFAFAPDVYFNGFLSLVAPNNRDRVRDALLEAATSLRRWLVAQLYAMVIIGILVGICSALLHIPLALLLGVFAGFLEFIPALGPVLFTIPAVLIAFTQSPTSVFNVLVVYFAVQQLESNIITPLLQQHAVQVPPAITLLAVVVGGLLLGPMGVVFGIPMTVVLISLAKHLYSENGSGDEIVYKRSGLQIIERF